MSMSIKTGLELRGFVEPLKNFKKGDRILFNEEGIEVQHFSKTKRFFRWISCKNKHNKAQNINALNSSIQMCQKTIDSLKEKGTFENAAALKADLKKVQKSIKCISLAVHQLKNAELDHLVLQLHHDVRTISLDLLSQAPQFKQTKTEEVNERLEDAKKNQKEKQAEIKKLKRKEERELKKLAQATNALNKIIGQADEEEAKFTEEIKQINAEADAKVKEIMDPVEDEIYDRAFAFYGKKTVYLTELPQQNALQHLYQSNEDVKIQCTDGVVFVSHVFLNGLSSDFSPQLKEVDHQKEKEKESSDSTERIKYVIDFPKFSKQTVIAALSFYTSGKKPPFSSYASMRQVYDFACQHHLYKLARHCSDTKTIYQHVESLRGIEAIKEAKHFFTHAQDKLAKEKYARILFHALDMPDVQELLLELPFDSLFLFVSGNKEEAEFLILWAQKHSHKFVDTEEYQTVITAKDKGKEKVGNQKKSLKKATNLSVLDPLFTTSLAHPFSLWSFIDLTPNEAEDLIEKFHIQGEDINRIKEAVVWNDDWSIDVEKLSPNTVKVSFALKLPMGQKRPNVRSALFRLALQDGEGHPFSLKFRALLEERTRTRGSVYSHMLVNYSAYFFNDLNLGLKVSEKFAQPTDKYGNCSSELMEISGRNTKPDLWEHENVYTTLDVWQYEDMQAACKDGIFQFEAIYTLELLESSDERKNNELT